MNKIKYLQHKNWIVRCQRRELDHILWIFNQNSNVMMSFNEGALSLNPSHTSSAASHCWFSFKLLCRAASENPQNVSHIFALYIICCWYENKRRTFSNIFHEKHFSKLKFVAGGIVNVRGGRGATKRLPKHIFKMICRHTDEKEERRRVGKKGFVRSVLLTLRNHPRHTKTAPKTSNPFLSRIFFTTVTFLCVTYTKIMCALLPSNHSTQKWNFNCYSMVGPMQRDSSWAHGVRHFFLPCPLVCH